MTTTTKKTDEMQYGDRVVVDGGETGWTGRYGGLTWDGWVVVLRDGRGEDWVQADRVSKAK